MATGNFSYAGTVGVKGGDGVVVMVSVKGSEGVARMLGKLAGEEFSRNIFS